MRFNLVSLFKIFLGFSIGVIALWYFFTKFNFHASLDVIYSASMVWLVLAIVFYYLAMFIKAVRWWYLLSLSVPDISITKTLTPYYMSIIANAFLPLRAGDILRIAYFKKTLNISAGTTTGCMLIERILDMFTLLLYMLCILYFVTNYKYIDGLMGDIFVALISSIILLIFMLLVCPLKVRSFLLNLFNKITFSSSKWKVSILNFAKDIVDSLTSIHSKKKAFVILGISFVGWAFEGGLFIFVSYSLGINGFELGALLSFCLATIIQAIPSTPASIGLFQLASFIGISSFGVAESVAGGFAILSHTIYFAALLLAGCILIVLPFVFHRVE